MARLSDVQEWMIRIHEKVAEIHGALVVREPGNSVSADAYDGLRKVLLQSAKNRRIHIAHLLSLSDSLSRDASMQLIRDRVSDFMTELGVVSWSDTSQPEFFDVTEGDGPILECIEPAVVERLEDGRLVEIRRGTARRLPAPETPATTDPEALPTEDVPPLDRVPDVVSTAEPTWESRSNRRVIVVAIAALLVGLLVGIVVSSDGGGAPSPTNTEVPDTVLTDETSLSQPTTPAAQTTTSGG